MANVETLELTLTHNERSFSDGDAVEFFFTADTAAELNFDDPTLSEDGVGYGANLTYDENATNGLDAAQYTDAPVSLGQFPVEPKFGGNTDTFELQIPADVETKLVAAINAGDDFHIIITSTTSDGDFTFSGKDNVFDPGNPQLTIGVGSGNSGELTCDLNADGQCDATDLELLQGSPVTPADISDWLAAASDPANPYLGGTRTFEVGDVNLDGSIDSTDLGALLNNFGDSGTYGDGNLNVDGTIDSTDLGLLLNNFGFSSATAVPEPGSAAIALALLLGCGGLVRRR